MKTLFERLKPELITAIELQSRKYPNLMMTVKEELQSKYSFIDLTVSTAYRLTDLTESKSFGINEIDECFIDRN